MNVHFVMAAVLLAVAGALTVPLSIQIGVWPLGVAALLVTFYVAAYIVYNEATRCTPA